jgi:hypothetical protein
MAGAAILRIRPRWFKGVAADDAISRIPHRSDFSSARTVDDRRAVQSAVALLGVSWLELFAAALTAAHPNSCHGISPVRIGSHSFKNAAHVS